MPYRLTSRFELPADKDKTADFTIDTKDKQYGKQYANLYWLRLVVLRKRVEERARKRWSKLPGEFDSVLGWSMLLWRSCRGAGEALKSRRVRWNGRELLAATEGALEGWQ